MGKKKKHKKRVREAEKFQKKLNCALRRTEPVDMVKEATEHLKSLSMPELKNLLAFNDARKEEGVTDSKPKTREEIDALFERSLLHPPTDDNWKKRFNRMYGYNAIYGYQGQPLMYRNTETVDHTVDNTRVDNPSWDDVIKRAVDQRRDWKKQELRFLKGSYTDPDEVADVIVFVSKSEKDLLKHTRGNITPLIREKFKVKIQEMIAEEEEEIREHRARYETYKRLSETFE